VAIDRAAVLRNAEKLLRQGKLDAALAEYLRVVEDQPSDWNTANTLGDLYLRAGQTDRAVQQFVRIADSLSGDGFLPKAAALYKKILKIRPGDEHALLQAGEMAARQGVLVDARTYLNAVAKRRTARGDDRGAAEVRGRLFAVHLSGGDLDRAREFADTDEELKALGQAFVARGDMNAAAEFFKEDTAHADPELLLAMARTRLQAGALDEGLTILRQLLNQDASRAKTIAAVGWELAASAPDAALLVAEVVLETAVIEADWVGAAAVLEEFVDRVPDHVPALLRLVEVCFDGGLETAMCTAQARLADAYLAAGCGAEARVIAEDLISRGMTDARHVERLRRALVVLGDPDPEGVIAERLGARLDDAAPTGLRADGEDDGLELPPHGQESALRLPPDVGEPGQPSSDDGAWPSGNTAEDVIEIDLSDMLADFTAVRAPEPSPPPRDLDEVFERFREETSRAPATDAARAEYERGIALQDSGRIDESIRAFESASREPTLRFRAAGALARVYLQRQERRSAVEWLELAVQSPAMDAVEAHALFYDLADTLESMHERARALAIFLELQADAGNYRDVSERIERLTRMQARG
jgi:tetratricopeptide (TPR) repeat protein